MSEPERFSISTRLYVRLRRLGGPQIDPLRMTHDDDYAREIAQTLARATGDEEVLRMAARLDAIVKDPRARPAPLRQTAPLPATRPAPTEEETEPSPLIMNRYVGALR